ncbi:oxidoreductase [Microsporum canis CBS 113480]|uniref:Oxidoreductase n=1 Tax=Arthroderma otae (strain ATCC MYA-4605 / CBS 113480) TaxID=554155 RepID=C5FK91_ARTOC|nr:oxidoreductase [Microsporum canis CBS 113480]EEQ30113.1 oxidoreductase [Microsporum canis CBS 113480]
MATKAIAVIAGVGPGTGASIARRFSRTYPVALLARNPKNYEGVIEDITSSGGQAIGIRADVSNASDVKQAFADIDKAFPGSLLAAAIYNVGGGLTVKPFLELSEDDFTQGFKTTGYPITPSNPLSYGIVIVQRLGGFNFSQAAIPRLLRASDLELPPTLIFTGATASLKGSAKFSSFAAGKFSLRAVAQSVAREFGPQGIHVCHAVVDGVIDTERTSHIQSGLPDAKLDPEAVSNYSLPGLILIPLIISYANAMD